MLSSVRQSIKKALNAMDIQANDGQFIRGLRRRLVVLFEPLTEAHRRLLQISQPDKAWNPCCESFPKLKND